VRTAIIGAGPTGLYLSIALARRGHSVTVLDRDPGPPAGEPVTGWARKGVMQFHHPHGFRQQVLEAILEDMPEVWDALHRAGAETVLRPDGADIVVGFNCRRSLFEKVLREAAVAEPGVEFVLAHADEVVNSGGRAAGVRAGSIPVPAGLVIDASGRAGQIGRGLRAPAENHDCGLAYISRQYELLPGAEDGPVNSPIGMVLACEGYLAIVFKQDNRTFSVLVARPAGDRDLARMRHPAVFEAGLRAIPALAAWTDPGRARPLTPVLPGGRLYNRYQGQFAADGSVPIPGLVFAGDSVCTTNPTSGRGVSTSLLQARQLARLVTEHRGDPESATGEFAAWCDAQIKPWFADHVYRDSDVARRWAGGDIDLTRPLPSDLVVAAAEADPSLYRVVGPYLQMMALPETLAAVQPQVRDLYASGWRPAPADAPSRDELAAVLARAAAPDGKGHFADSPA
jgi:flavin-dependent dehydrogenase